MNSRKTILVTGGAGYIGNPTVHALSDMGYQVIVYDTRPQMPQGLTDKRIIYIQGDIRDQDTLLSSMQSIHPDCVVHLAALISVFDSESNPNLYYDVNVTGTQNILTAMKQAGCTKLIFASSAAVYKDSDHQINEGDTLHSTSVYGKTKMQAEEIIKNDSNTKSVIFRYFNVSGGTNNGVFSEPIEHNPKLIPSVLRVGMNLANHVVIYGNHYATPDGTAVRDYVSLEDVVQANVLAVEYMLCKCDSIVCNIGSGIGTSNLEVVHAVEKQFRKKIPVVFASPRKESIYSVADIHKARQILGWEPTHSDIPSLIKNFGYTATP